MWNKRHSPYLKLQCTTNVWLGTTAWETYHSIKGAGQSIRHIGQLCRTKSETCCILLAAMYIICVDHTAVKRETDQITVREPTTTSKSPEEHKTITHDNNRALHWLWPKFHTTHGWRDCSLPPLNAIYFSRHRYCPISHCNQLQGKQEIRHSLSYRTNPRTFFGN